MGYYSTFRLSTHENSKVNLASFFKEIKNSNFYEIFDSDIDNEIEDIESEQIEDSFSLDSSDEFKWYDANDDLKEFSKKFPETVFQLDAVGEDGERWRVYFKNGKCQEAPAIITFDEYDENKLE